jgi:hypothetical protein
MKKNKNYRKNKNEEKEKSISGIVTTNISAHSMPVFLFIAIVGSDIRTFAI